MTFSTTSQIINGVRRTVLIICTDEPYTPENLSVIRQTIESDNEITYVDWHNAQTVLYKQNLESGGKYYSWMIVDHKDTTTVTNNTAKVTELQEQVQSLLPKTPTTLAEYKQSKITESKTVLEGYLSSHPLTFNHNGVDKQYSVTQEKQSLLTSVLLMAKTAIEASIAYEITWNATGQPCEVWTYEELLQLSLAINTYVKPLVTEQQYCEVAINNCITIDEVNAIVIDYDTKPYSTNV